MKLLNETFKYLDFIREVQNVEDCFVRKHGATGDLSDRSINLEVLLEATDDIMQALEREEFDKAFYELSGLIKYLHGHGFYYSWEIAILNKAFNQYLVEYIAHPNTDLKEVYR